ncbi:MAG TPA: cysteine peptidase family C39 domain-containing protein [archaeon]|nr:cysteine peptidase family C39 domain-containing protein [archaeon]
MKTVFPYFTQRYSYSCGPACLRMAFAAHGLQISEKEIALATGTSPSGTSIQGMLDGCRKHGFKRTSYENSSLTDIKSAIRRGVPVVVNYMEPNDYEDHFAMVVGVGTKYVVLNDPWNGRSFRVERKDFMKRWWGWTNDRKKKIRKWMMTVEKRVAAE